MPRQQILTEQDYETIKKMIEVDNIPVVKVADKYNVCDSTMNKYLRKYDILTKSKRQLRNLALIDDAIIINDYKNGECYKEINEKYDIPYHSVEKIIRNSGIHIRTNSEVHTKYSLNTNYFDNIDTINKAYLLGFICADGYVTKRHEIGITVNLKDEELIDFFLKELESDRPKYYPPSVQAVTAIVQNIALCDKIQEYGILPCKSLTINIETVIEKAKLSDRQIKAFLLGYFDGDGCITISLAKNKKTKLFTWSVTGTMETCSYYKQYFNNIGFFTKRHKDDKNNWTYCVSGRNLVKNSLSQLYEVKDELDFYLKRKYNKFIQANY